MGVRTESWGKAECDGLATNKRLSNAAINLQLNSYLQQPKTKCPLGYIDELLWGKLRMSRRLRAAARSHYCSLLAASAISLLSVGVATQLAWGQEQTPAAQPSAGSNSSAGESPSAPAPGNNSDAPANPVSSPQTVNGPTPVPDVRVTAPVKKVSHSKTVQTQGPSYPDLSLPQDETAPDGQPADGSVAAGYRVDTVSDVGPFANMKLQDTPYSYSVLSSDFINNTASYATPGGGVLDKSPFFSSNHTDQRPIVSSGSQRGINNDGGSNFYRIDGLAAPFTSSTFGVEPYDRIEILSGLSGFMYGVSPAAGYVNYVLKRPTTTPFASLVVSDPNGSSIYAHGDIGGMSRDGQFGYRLNFAGQDGDTIVDGQRSNREMFSGAFDYRIDNHTKLEFDARYGSYEVTGAPAIWLVLPGSQYPSNVPDPHKIWSQPFARVESSAWTAGTKLTSDITDWLSVRAAFRYTEQSFGPEIQSFNLLSGDTYNQFLSFNAPQGAEAFSGYAYADVKFDTFSFAHKLTLGWTGNQNNFERNTDGLASTFITGLTLSHPEYIANPNLPFGNGYDYRSQRTIYQNTSIGDEIELNRYFSALVGASYTQIGDVSYEPTGQADSSYDAAKWTPTYALMFKPFDWVTTYVSYIQGLQEGMIVDDPNATNDGAVLPPYLREQYEVGAKATLGNTFLTLAYFDIDSALEYSILNPDGSVTYVQSGRQKSKGVEFSATGEIAKGVRLLGGFMFADSRVTKNESNPSLNGTVPQSAVTELTKATLEYDVPFIRGLTLIGGAYWTGGFYADQANTQWVSGRVTFDAGARYKMNIEGHDVTAGVYVSNLTDEAYWVGASTVGDPRRISVSLQTVW